MVMHIHKCTYILHSGSGDAEINLFSLHCRSCLWRFKTSLLGLSQRTDLPLAKTNAQDGAQAAVQYSKEETPCSSNWTGRNESYLFTVWQQTSSATGFELCEVSGKEGIIWIRTCSKKKNKKNSNNKISRCESTYFLFLTFLSLPLSVSFFLSEGSNNTTTHPDSLSHTHAQTHTCRQTPVATVKSWESAQYLSWAVRVNLKP